jgi:hypothetical protein
MALNVKPQKVKEDNASSIMERSTQKDGISSSVIKAPDTQNESIKENEDEMDGQSWVSGFSD